MLNSTDRVKNRDVNALLVIAPFTNVKRANGNSNEGRKGREGREGQPVARATCFERSVRPPHESMRHCLLGSPRCQVFEACRALEPRYLAAARPSNRARPRQLPLARLSREPRTHYARPFPPRATRNLPPPIHSWGHALFTGSLARSLGVCSTRLICYIYLSMRCIFFFNIGRCANDFEIYTRQTEIKIYICLMFIRLIYFKYNF